MSDKVRLTIESSVLEDWVQRGEVWIIQDHEPHYTLEEAWKRLSVALREAEGSTGKRFDEVLLRITPCTFDRDRWAAKSSGEAWVYGPNPLAALEALAAAAKPALPDPDDMSAEECEEELDAAGALVVWQSSTEVWYVRCIANERQIACASCYSSKKLALRAAVRALREHQASQSREVTTHAP